MSVRPLISSSRYAASLPRVFIRCGHTRKRHNPNTRPLANNPHLGERIWMFYHEITKNVVYTLTSQMNQALSKQQIDHHGKLLHPPSLRKDYWHPLAMVEFGEGKNLVGLSVFQRLREFRRRHELEWEEELFNLSRKDRAVALKAQLANSVADLAAVLAGAGKGNKMWKKVKATATATAHSSSTTSTDVGSNTATDATASAAPAKITGAAGIPDATASESKPDDLELEKATIFWKSSLDQAYAKAWTPNVTHEIAQLAVPRFWAKVRDSKTGKVIGEGGYKETLNDPALHLH